MTKNQIQKFLVVRHDYGDSTILDHALQCTCCLIEFEIMKKVILLLLAISALSGCRTTAETVAGVAAIGVTAAASVAATGVETAASVAGTVAVTTAKVTGEVVSGAVKATVNH